MIMVNVGFNTYYGLKDLWTKFKKWRERRNNKVINLAKGKSNDPSESFESVKAKEQIEAYPRKPNQESISPLDNNSRLNDPAEKRDVNPGKKPPLGRPSRRPKRESVKRSEVIPASKIRKVLVKV